MRYPPRNARDYDRSRQQRRTSPRGGSVAELLGAGLIGRVTRQGGLVAHYDARDIVAADGDAISLWPDRVGAQDLSSVADVNRPSYSASSWARGPAVEFGASAGLRSLYASGIASDEVSAVAICTSGAAATGTAIEYTGNVYNNRGFALLTNGGKRRAELGADVARSYAEGGDVITDEPVAIAMVGSRATSPDECDVWSEAGQITPSASGTVDGGGDHEAAYLYLGSRLATGANALDGMIRSVIIVESALDSASMQTLIDGMVASAGGLTLTQSAGGAAAGVSYNFDEVHDTVVTDDNGTLYDDGGPSGAYSDAEYWVTIDAPPGQQVELTIVSFEFGNPGQWYERLRIWDNNTSSGTLLGEFYGSTSAGGAFAPTAGQVLTSTAGHVFIRQDSSTTGTNDGFEITWRFV